MVVRRPVLTEPHEALLICQSVHDLNARFGEFADMSGVPEEYIISSPLSAVPLPDYRGIGEGRKRWAGTNPLFMWHPFMWLPARLANRRVLENPNPDGSPLVEPDSVYAIRVLLELAGSGLYDAESGTWLDVLSAVGMDITEPEVQERVTVWLDGGEDPELDAIDLTVMLSDGDTDGSGDWAFQLAIDLTVPALKASWAVLANDLHELVSNVVESGDSEDVFNILTTACYSVLTSLTGAHPDVKGTWEGFLDRVQNTSSDGLDSSLATVMLENLVHIRDTYWSDFEAFPALLAGVVDDGSTEPDVAEPVVDSVEPPSRPVFETLSESAGTETVAPVDAGSDPLEPPVFDSPETVTVVPPSPWDSPK